MTPRKDYSLNSNEKVEESVSVDTPACGFRGSGDKASQAN